MITGVTSELSRSILANHNCAFRLAYSILHNQADAEDAIQDASINAYLKYSTFKGISFRSWFLTIVRNRCYDSIRRHKKYVTTSLDYNYNTRENEDVLESSSFKDEEDLSPEQRVEQNETVRAICQCVDQLPVNYRKAMVLVDIQGMDYAEAARILGKPVGTIKSRLARGRAQVQQMLIAGSRSRGNFTII